jgi:hypothetical protein
MVLIAEISERLEKLLRKPQLNGHGASGVCP